MSTSEARIASSPQTPPQGPSPAPSGREKSRRNALKHGLCAKVLSVEDPRAVEERVGALTDGSMPPPESFGGWLATQIATISFQLERAQAMQRAAVERISLRAGVVWDDDRKLEATVLGGKLPARPDQVLEQLRQTPQGCQWLMGRWAMLAHVADSSGGWTPEHVKMAFDLVGTPHEFREGSTPGTEIEMLDGKPIGPALDPAALARRNIDELLEQAKRTLPVDDADRQRAEAGLADDPELRRLRRYEADLHRRLRWMVELLHGKPAEAPAQQPPTPEPEMQPKPEPTPRPVPIRAIPQTPPTPGPTHLSTRTARRAEKKLIKAESRREAKLRKLEQLRS